MHSFSGKRLVSLFSLEKIDILQEYLSQEQDDIFLLGLGCSNLVYKTNVNEIYWINENLTFQQM